jgi:hypothetical protein
VRKQPARIVDGRAEGGYNEACELICPSCGDSPDLDYSEIPLGLQWLRGPHTLEVSLAVYHKHQGVPWQPRPWPKLPDVIVNRGRDNVRNCVILQVESHRAPTCRAEAESKGIEL